MMKTDFDCPVCCQNSWVDVGRYHFVSASETRNGRFESLIRRVRRVLQVLVLARPPKRMLSPPPASAYQRLRCNVLFDVWFSGAREVELQSMYCRNCGSVAYSPRPDSQDLDAKYQYLKQHEPDIGGQTGFSDVARILDDVRAKRVFGAIMRRIDKDLHFCTEHLTADLKGRSVRGDAVTMTSQSVKFGLSQL